MRNNGTSRSPGLWGCLALVVATLAVYGQVSRFEFINLDDQAYVTQNEHVLQGLSWQGIVWAFQTGHASNWHPLTWLSHMLDAQLFGLRAGWHHLTNLLFHVANTILVFVVLRKMTGALWRSVFVAGLFALHPTHVESVAWVSERKDVLSSFFGLLSLLTYVAFVQAAPTRPLRVAARERPGNVGKDATRRKRSRGTGLHEPGRAPGIGSAPDHRRFALPYLLSLGFYALSLMSKPMLVTLPFALLLLDYWPLRRASSATAAFPSPPSRLLAEKLPYLALSVVSCVVTFQVQKQGRSVLPVGALSVGDRLANALVSYARYVGKLLWPGDLAVFYPYPGGWSPAAVALSGLFLLVVSIAAILSARRQPWFGVGWAWFMGLLVPVIGLVQVGEQAMADRYLYLPSIGFFLLVSWSVPSLAGRWRHRRAALAVLASSVLIGCLITARIQASHWRGSDTLFRHALEVTTDNYLAHDCLGEALVAQGRRSEARVEFEAALRIKPHFTHATANLAKLHFEEKRLEPAAALFAQVTAARPWDPEARQNLASVLASQGKLDEAVALYQEALRLDPENAAARQNLSTALAIRPRWAAASTRYAAGLELLRQRRAEAALDEFREAVRLRPEWPELLNTAAWVLATHPSAELRDGAQAVILAALGCALTGNADPVLLSTLAAAYAEAGRFAEATATQQKAWELAQTQGSGQAAAYLQRLELFRSRRAYHEP